MHRNANGTFARGHKFAKGRIKGSRNWATILKEHLRSSQSQTAAMLVNGQLERGRRWAVQVMNGMMPKGQDSLPELDMSDIQTMADVLGAQNAVLSALATRQITTGDCQKLMRRLVRRRNALLKRRLSRLSDVGVRRSGT